MNLACWHFAFFKPTRPNIAEKLSMSLINESQYDLSFTIGGKMDKQEMGSNLLKSNLSMDKSAPTILLAQAAMPVWFSFTPISRGPYLFPVSINIQSPFIINTEAATFGKPLHLVGICIEPYSRLGSAQGERKQGDSIDKNGIDFLRTWLSHPKRIMDEYPSLAEDRAVRFDTKVIAKGIFIVFALTPR
jgi:hypothetical protein